MSIFRQKNRADWKQRLLPEQPCLLCSQHSHNGLCCPACERELPQLRGNHCPVCSLPTPHNTICGHCLKRPPAFEQTLAAYYYHYPLDKLLQQFKYQSQLAAAHYLARRLASRIPPQTRPDALIAMPLHPRKLQQRGFNQAQLLADQLGKLLHIKVLTHACTRIRNTPSQSSLPWKQRQQNIRHAFCCQQPLNGLTIALIDDVMTTGATLNALADTVRTQGASHISCWVIARTLRQPPSHQTCEAITV